MKVKDVKKKIDSLQRIYDNMIYIHNTILHMEGGTEMAKNVEELCDLNDTLRNLATATAQVVSDEICRLNTLIDNADVNTLC